MKSGFQDVVVGCLLNIVAFFVLTIIVLLSNNPSLMGILVIIVPVSFAFGRRIISRFCGPETALWLMTNNVGVSFAYLSIDLFRQDKKFSKVEMESLCRYFAKEFGDGVYSVVKSFVLKYKTKNVDIKRQTQKVSNLDHRYRAMFLHHLFSMALANGNYSNEEDLYLQRIARLLRISQRNFLIIKSNFVRSDFGSNTQNQKDNRQTKSNSDSSRKTSFSKQFLSSSISAYLGLGLHKEATNDEIKKAYRRLVMKYHPDRLSSKSEATKKIAKQRFREITQAYELIKKERNIK